MPWLRSSALLLGLVAGMAIGCEDDDVECDAETEIEVSYGSDIAGESDQTACEAVPASCGKQPDCACLEGQMLDNGVRFDFCLQEGDCDDSDGVVQVVCPGG